MELFKYLDVNNVMGIAGLVALIIVVKMFVKFIGNHIQHSTRSNQKLADAIEQMLKFLERNNKG